MDINLRDALATNMIAAETAACLIFDLGLGRTEVRENFASGTDKASRAIVKACRSVGAYRTLAATLETLI